MVYPLPIPPRDPRPPIPAAPSAAGQPNRDQRRFYFNVICAALIHLAGIGCATSSVESRRTERATAYQTLSDGERALVDRGQIKVGMNQDAVYIAWGAPSEILESEDSSGRVTSWIYHGSWMEETRYWTYREVTRDGTPFLERYLDRDYHPRDYIRAEIIFRDGKVARWRTLPRPL